MKKVYPRVCGGTLRGGRERNYLAGLSLRVRGNLEEAEVFIDDEGSIPACAGEPFESFFSCQILTVYPRVCGGTLWLTVI